MKKFLLTIIILLISTNLHARIYIPVDQPSDKKFPIAICDLKQITSYHDFQKLDEQIPNIIKNDLILSGYFDITPSEAFLEDPVTAGVTRETIDFTKWTALEIMALVKGTITKEGKEINVQLKLFDPYLGQMLVGKEYKGTVDDVRTIAHRFSDEIMEVLTGVRGIFNTKIAYSANLKKGIKAIYVMDVDGQNNYRISDSKSLNIGPAWSPNGNEIAFASYMNGTPEIYVTNLTDDRTRQLTFNKATNITPVWHPDGRKILFSSSVTGDASLRLVDPRGKFLKQITTSYAIDVCPDFSPDGSDIVFASERAGKLHLFRMPIDGSDAQAQRLTFVGHFNDTPAWSPDGTKIAFASQDAGNFDIFIMNPDGSYIQRLTIDSGNNEHPTWSPDGRFIAFQSSRNGEQAIYMMRSDGSNQVKISQGNGRIPDWGPYVR